MITYLKRQRCLAFLIILQAAALFPFRFTNELGERDSYRMFIGLVDTLKTGALFNSPLLYNREPSFGYYGILYALTPLTGHAPAALMSLMNWIGLLSVILFTVPNYIVTERLFGKQVAVASSIILAATPVWWHCGLYGHPVVTALFLFFSGMAVLCPYERTPSFAVRAIALVLFAVALTMRFDIVLLFIAMVAMLWQVRRIPSRGIAREALLYILGSVALFGIAEECLPRVSQGVAPDSILSLLARFEHTNQIFASFRQFVFSLGQGFTPILIAIIPFSMWMLIRRKQYPLAFFVSGEIIVNLVFWFPNAYPARHFLFMAPAVSISAALVFLALVPARIPRLSSLHGVLIGSAVGISIVFTSLAFNYGKGYLGYFPSQFSERLSMKGQIAEANHIAEALAHLPPLSTPVIVLCDSTLVLAKLEQIAFDTSAIYRMVPSNAPSLFVHDVHEGSNRFIMIEHGWDETDVKGFDRSGEYVGIPVLSAPYLSIPYTGPRARIWDPINRQ